MANVFLLRGNGLTFSWWPLETGDLAQILDTMAGGGNYFGGMSVSGRETHDERVPQIRLFLLGHRTVLKGM